MDEKKRTHCSCWLWLPTIFAAADKHTLRFLAVHIGGVAQAIAPDLIFVSKFQPRFENKRPHVGHRFHNCAKVSIFKNKLYKA